MTEIKRTPTPWNLCYHLRSPEHDASCKCGYRGSIWSADGEYIVLEMGSSPDIDGRGKIQGHTQPQASRPVQLADAALIVEAVNSHASLTAERDRLREENERLRNCLETITGIHGTNPSLPYADVPEADYLKHVLWEVRQLAREALKGDE